MDQVAAFAVLVMVTRFLTQEAAHVNEVSFIFSHERHFPFGSILIDGVTTADRLHLAPLKILSFLQEIYVCCVLNSPAS